MTRAKLPEKREATAASRGPHAGRSRVRGEVLPSIEPSHQLLDLPHQVTRDDRIIVMDADGSNERRIPLEGQTVHSPAVEP
jgi:hypothetical protein